MEGMEGYIIMLVICIIVIIVALVMKSNADEDYQKAMEEYAVALVNERVSEIQYLKKYGVIDGDNKLPHIKVKYYGGHPEIDKILGIFEQQLYIGIDDNNLFLLNCNLEDNSGKFNIPISDIIYYQIEGEVYNELKIEGGGGGGVSVGGALVGGIIAGEAGAVLGGRKKVEPVTSSNIRVDERKTIIKFNYQSKLTGMTLDSSSYEWLLNNLPEKEMRYIMYTNNNQQMNNPKDDVIEQIKKLSELKEQGILTEEEFIDKKKILLDKIN